MFNAIRIFTAFISLATGSLSPNATAVVADQAPVVVMIDMSPEEQAETLRIVGYFAEAGLPLPPVTFRHHLDPAGCNGSDGLHRSVGSRSVIELCNAGPGSGTDRVILHELAHAWSFHSLTDERKAAFKELRGWKYWLDYDNADWADNGAEQAAEIIVWALSDHPVQVIKVDHNTCTELLAGYITLTGLTPLHGYTKLCEPPITTAIRS